MLRKNIKKLLCILSAVIIAFSCFCVTASAAQDDTNTFRFSCATPSTDGNTGYIELCLKSSSGVLSGKVIAWNTFYRSTSTTDNNFQQVDSLPLRVVVNSDSVQFYSVYPVGADSAGVSMSYFSMNSGYNTNYSTTSSFPFTNEADSVCTINISSSEIVGFHVYGNFSSVTSNISTNTLFYTIYNEEVVQYNQLLKIIDLINTLAADNDTIISQLNTIIANTDTIEAKLQSAINLLTTIETDLDAVNAELDNIEANTDELEAKLDTIIGILDNENQAVPKPDTSTTDEYIEKEQAIIDSTSSGRDEVTSVFTGVGNILSTSDSIGRGLLAVTSIFTEFIGGLPWLSSLLNFSVAIGLFAFILGITSVIVHHFGSSSEGGLPKEEKPNVKMYFNFFNGRFGGKKK